MSRRLSLLPWLFGYVAFIAAAVGATCVWRANAVIELSTPEARQEWQKYQSELIADEAHYDTPVKHRISLRDEPPLLVWLKERFAVILAAVVVFGSLFYGITMFIVRGLASSTAPAPMIDEGNATSTELP